LGASVLNLPGAAPRGFSFWPPSPGSLDPFSVFQDGIRPAEGHYGWELGGSIFGLVGKEQVQIELDQKVLPHMGLPGPGTDSDP